jgi:hypothetical protein
MILVPFLLLVRSVSIEFLFSLKLLRSLLASSQQDYIQKLYLVISLIFNRCFIDFVFATNFVVQNKFETAVIHH